jgi:hypothetical protein
MKVKVGEKVQYFTEVGHVILVAESEHQALVRLPSGIKWCLLENLVKL